MQNADIDLINDEAYQAALEEWLGVLGRLWTAYGKPIELDRMALYQEELAIVPMGLLQKAVSRVIREHRFSNVPNVGEVWAAVRKELGDPQDIQQGIEDWKDMAFRRCMVVFPAVEPSIEYSVAVETEMV